MTWMPPTGERAASATAGSNDRNRRDMEQLMPLWKI